METLLIPGRHPSHTYRTSLQTHFRSRNLPQRQARKVANTGVLLARMIDQ